ncbi:MAG TPA: O-methyltransferase [Bacteroidia bacterium]
MDFIDPAIQAYSESFTHSESELLAELNRYTHTNVLKPRMLSGHLQGRFISLMSKMQKPSNVLDIGTYTGYSALCLVEGLAENGTLFTIDNNEEVMAVAAGFIARHPRADDIKMITGDAIESIKMLNQQVNAWDLVWMDAEKSEYSTYYDLVIDKLSSGGLILADNVLWSGKVIDEKSLSKDEDTIKLHEFNRKVNSDTRVESLLMPIRDGIMMIRKK